MNQTLIANVKDKSVYLMNEKNISFYISVPKGGSASIVLNLVSDVNFISTNNNVSVLTERITNLYGDFCKGDYAVVTPILDSNILEQVKLFNDAKVFGYLDKVMGFLINTSYGFLKSSGLSVNNKIGLNNNVDYHIFNDWFVSRYNGRVGLINFDGDVRDSVVNRFDNVSEVVSVDKESSELANDVLDNTTTFTSDVGTNNMVNDVREPGFVSYVLLGVIVAVVSLVILYMLL